MILSKNLAEIEAERDTYAKELVRELEYFDQKTMRAKTADACIQRVKIKEIIAKMISTIDREHDYIMQRINKAATGD